MSGLFLVALLLAAFTGGVAYAAEDLPDLGGGEFQLGAYLLASTFVFVDMIDLLVRVHRRRLVAARSEGGAAVTTSTPLEVGSFSPYQRRLHLRPYAIVVSVHELGDQLDAFVESMANYRDVLWVIDDASGDGTCERLRQAGLRCVRSEINRKKPGSLRALLKHLPHEVQTVLVIDPDCRLFDVPGDELSHLENVIFEFQRSGHAAACPRIEVVPGNALARLQRLEFAMCFGIGRRSLGDFGILSGIAMYRRDALVRLLEKHSLSVYAEDLENTMQLLSAGETIYYDERFLVWTHGKESFSSWFSQRVGWHFGFARVYVRYLRQLLRFAPTDFMCLYQYLVYMGVFMLLLHPLKVIGLLILLASSANGVDLFLGTNWVPNDGIFNPWFFPLVYAKYLVFTLGAVPLASRPGDRWEHAGTALAYLPYSLLHVVPMTLGYLNWFSLRLLGRRVYRDHYTMDEPIDGRVRLRS